MGTGWGSSAEGVAIVSEAIPRVSVVTVTNRPGSVDVTWGSLERQTLGDFEWILCDELYAWRREEVAGYVADPRLRHIPAPVVEGHLWNLNKAHNEALRHCRGELVVALQDFIWVPSDGLQKFWDLYQRLGPHMFTGCGHKAASPDSMVEPGKITIFGEPMTNPPTGVWEVDVRMSPDGNHRRDVEETEPDRWELNWAAAPLSMFRELGGFEEAHDAEFYSCDNLDIAYRADRLGYRTYIDWTNQCLGFPHQLYWSRPEDWDERHGNRGPFREWFDRWVAQGQPALPYLADGR